jgi:hypothetical protein
MIGIGRSVTWMKVFLGATAILFVSWSSLAFSYPDKEIVGTGDVDPPFDFGITANLTGFILTSDTSLAVSYADILKMIDTGRYEVAKDQPPAPNADDNTDSNLAGIAYDATGGQIVASNQDGDVVIYSLSDITAKPQVIDVTDGDVLTAVVIDQNGQYAYIGDKTDTSIQVVDLSQLAKSYAVQVNITGVTTFNFTDGVFNEETDEVYFTTDAGYVVYMSSGGQTSATIQIVSSKNLQAVDAFTDGDYLYVLESDTPDIYKISTSTHAVVKHNIDITANQDPTDLIITPVDNPGGAYAYIAGSDGISIVNTANDEVLDLGSDEGVAGEPLPVSSTPARLAASSAADGYVYMGFTTGHVGVLSENPWVYIDSITYGDGAHSLTTGGNFVITFGSDTSGTYEILSGGGVEADGHVLTDSEGHNSGDITKDTPISLTFNYDDNKSAFDEGENEVWVFVTSNDIRGRRAGDVDVDTPPGVVKITSTGWGNGTIYVTFKRLTASDISKYRFYVGRTEHEAVTSTDVHTQVSQASSGKTQTADVGGLTNGILYYVAVEAIDDAGNVSPHRSVTSQTPALTKGPLEILGEHGCSLANRQGRPLMPCIVIASAILILLMSRTSVRRIFFVLLFIMCVWTIAVPNESCAQDVQEQNVSAYTPRGKESPQWFEMEIKGGFWLPKNSVLDQVFTPCCNIIPSIQGGLLIHRKYGVGLGVGFLYKTARAFGTGEHAGQRSTERFYLMLVPMETNFTWRADYFSWRYLVPYLRGGVDYVYFRQVLSGKSISGLKFGLHGAGGLQINVGEMAGGGVLDGDYGINDLFFTLEAKYQWIDNFGSRGLDLSGFVYSAGLLIEF